MNKVKEKTVYTIFADNLNGLLVQNKKSRKEVCRDLDIKYTTFCDWINGRTIPKGTMVEKLGAYFQVGSSYFFIDKEDSQKEDFVDRIITYASKIKELPMSTVNDLSDDQIQELLNAGFCFHHKSLKEYIEESGGEFVLSEQLDWGEPKGREIW